MAAFQHHGPQAQSLQTAADLKAVGSGFQKEDVLSGKFLACPVKQRRKAQVFATGQLTRVVRGGSPENRRRVDVGVAVQADITLPFVGGAGAA